MCIGMYMIIVEGDNNGGIVEVLVEDYHCLYPLALSKFVY